MGKLILICDDDRPILEVTRTILQDRDMQVVSSVDCNDIVQKALTCKPDLILMDVWIPEHGGDHATRELKFDPRTSHIPVILFSAVNNLEAITRSCGADGYIAKPFELEEMIYIIEKHLDTYQQVSA
jgi:CheY-like chemotaxis protein